MIVPGEQGGVCLSHHWIPRTYPSARYPGGAHWAVIIPMLCSGWGSRIFECLVCAVSVLNSNVTNWCLSWELKGSIQARRENSGWGQEYLKWGQHQDLFWFSDGAQSHSLSFQYSIKIRVSGNNGGGGGSITLQCSEILTLALLLEKFAPLPEREEINALTCLKRHLEYFKWGYKGRWNQGTHRPAVRVLIATKNPLAKELIMFGEDVCAW